MAPLVSVVIPTRDRRPMLMRAVESVRAQTFEDFEIVVVDDGSTDDTTEGLAALREPRRWPPTAGGVGGGGARNAGIAAATGRWVAFLDDDDAWLPSKLERQVEMLRAHPQLGLVYCGYREVRQDDGQVLTIREPSHRGDIFRVLLERNVIGTTSTVVAPRRVLDRVGGFNPTLPSNQDWDLWIRIARDAPVDFVAAPLVDYSVHPARITENMRAKAEGRRHILAVVRREITEDMPDGKRILAEHHYWLGHHLCHAGDLAEGRRHLFEALRLNPRDRRPWKLLGPALAGPAVYGGLLRLKRRLGR